MAKTPTSGRSAAPDASQGYRAPPMVPDMAWRSIGSSGLRQYSGYVREEFLPNLRGRQAARTYREMMDNSPTVGAILFAIQQSMRQVTWRVETADDSPASVEGGVFVESCMEDMTHGWPDFVSESLSMLPYGFAPHEIVYKRRLGKQKSAPGQKKYSSKFADGKVGWAKLPLRGQDTILKWFFDEEGDVTGLTQQPWFGGLIDIPIEKLLLFRPRPWKNNPEGYSILRNSYRPWWFCKRLEEQEAIALERMSGTPEFRVPNELLESANAGDAQAIQALEAFKNIVTGIKVDEQMGLVTPSDTYMDGDGKRSNIPMYEFRYNVPQGGRTAANFDVPIQRHKLDIMTSVLADFLVLGHSARGTQSLATVKVDLFFQATEGWLESNAAVLNETGIKQLWEMNGEPEDTAPQLAPDMPKRVDLDVLGNFILQMSQSGARLFPDDDLENYLRDVADLPELSEEQLADAVANAGEPDANPVIREDLQKALAGMIGRRLDRTGLMPRRSGPKKKK